MNKFVAWQFVSSVMKNEQLSQNLLLKVAPRSTFRNNFFQPATNGFAAGQVDPASWKSRNINPKHATKPCCATSWELLYLVFSSLYRSGTLNPWIRLTDHVPAVQIFQSGPCVWNALKFPTLAAFQGFCYTMPGLAVPGRTQDLGHSFIYTYMS